MKATKVRIQNFRSLRDSGEFPLDEKVTTILGKNEAGKTNLLRVLHSFNLTSKYSEEDLCSYSESKSKDISHNMIPIVTITFVPSPEELDRLVKVAEVLKTARDLTITKFLDGHYRLQFERPKTTSIGLDELKVDEEPFEIESISAEQFRVQLSKFLNDAVTAKFEGHSARYPAFSGNKPSYDSLRETFLATDFSNADSRSKAFETLVSGWKNLPNRDQPIIDDIERFARELNELKNSFESQTMQKILDLVPRFIYFDSVDELHDRVSLESFLSDQSKYRTLRNLCQLAGLRVERLKELSVHDRRFATDEASVAITGMVNGSWKQDIVKVIIGVDGVDLFLYIEDNVGARDRPSDRSKGFQYFLSFYINFTAETRGALKNSVLLLDDPGVFLHPSGQRDMLNTLEKIAETNQVVFSTHSPFQIDRAHLNRIRILTKKEARIGTVVSEDVHSSDRDSLEPIRTSIGVTMGDSLIFNKSNVIVEGYSDYLILEAFSEFCHRGNKVHLNLSDVAVVPVGGADKVPYYVLLVWKENLRFAAILDGDSKGREIAKELTRKHQVDEKNLIMLKSIFNAEKDVETEDLIAGELYHRAVQAAYEKSKAIPPAPDNRTRCKYYEEQFAFNKLGDFSKVLVARKLYELLLNDNREEGFEASRRNFEQLFSKINAVFETDSDDVTVDLRDIKRIQDSSSKGENVAQLAQELPHPLPDEAANETQRLNDKVYDYIVKHEGVISISKAREELGISAAELKQITETLKKTKRLR